MDTQTLPRPAAIAVPRISAPPWERLARIGLLGATGLLYLWGLGESGWGNSFYAAAAQAGSESWKAFFFGSSDAANSITVDKTPLSLWPMALAVRLFGLSSWSILVPQALEGRREPRRDGSPVRRDEAVDLPETRSGRATRSKHYPFGRPDSGDSGGCAMRRTGKELS